MCFNLLTYAAMSVIILTAGCTIAEKFVYSPNINQGNYFSSGDIAKIQKGMTKQQIIYILGTPMLKSQINQNVWYYVFRQQFGHEKIKQKTLTLVFNRDGILVEVQIVIA